MPGGGLPDGGLLVWDQVNRMWLPAMDDGSDREQRCRVVQVQCGSRHTVALLHTDSRLVVAAAGLPSSTNLALPDCSKLSATQYSGRAVLPTKVLCSHGQMDVCFGMQNSMTCMLRVTGYNYWGQLGTGDTFRRLCFSPALVRTTLACPPCAATVSPALCLLSTHQLAHAHASAESVYGWPAQTQDRGLKSMFDVIELLCVWLDTQGLKGAAIQCVNSGEHHCAAIARNGDIYMWGR